MLSTVADDSPRRCFMSTVANFLRESSPLRYVLRDDQKHNENSTTGHSHPALSDLSIEFSFEDMAAATDGFDSGNLLADGSFGRVYKGRLKDGTEVAVKVVEESEHCGFEEEVRVLSRFRHPNLVSLMGFAREARGGSGREEQTRRWVPEGLPDVANASFEQI